VRCIISPNDVDLTTAPVLQSRERRIQAWIFWRNVALRISLFLFSITIFVLALVLMKEGARPLAPLIRDRFSVNSSASALGFGWISASVALSGSPVAATALAFLDAGVLSPGETFAMIAGSRLGAAFIVLLIGITYLLRGKKREVSLGAGLLSLLVTQTLYIPVLGLGFFILSRGWLQRMQIQADQAMNSPFELLLDPFVAFLERSMPAWLLFPLGFLLVVSSLWLFDRAIPDLHLKESSLGLVHHLLYRPVVTFLLGAGITAITMSVSVSLSLLIPLSARGYIRRENLIPYILGANITTFVDTLIAAALLANPAAVTVVLVQMISVTVVSLLILTAGFRMYERLLERLVSKIGARKSHLLAYISIIFITPLLLLIFG
jgi:Na+/phosphate symporter